MSRAGSEWRCVVTGLMVLAAGGCGETGGKQTAAQVADELSEVRIEPGQWEATNEVIEASASGLPPEMLAQMKGQKTSLKNCVTPEQAAKPDANFLSAQKDSNCTYQDFSMRGGRLEGTMTCTPAGSPAKMVMKMEGEYGAARYDLTTSMQTEGLPGGQQMTIKARTIGRRIGDCA